MLQWVVAVRICSMKNILIVDGARNATFSVFQATDDEYAIIFPNDQDMELIEDLIQRLGDDEAGRFLAPLWDRPILKREAMGIHGTLFFDNEVARRIIPASKREIDWDDSSINQAQRDLFSRYR
uniref:Uncharacterized protein n=2 Tax=Ochrobactrum sp. LM19 TaxID=1449781 RepID=A0A0D5A134_9HYPH|nr:hypothetical protein pLM19O1_p21 [Ochrobactrum sp. LM19]